MARPFRDILVEAGQYLRNASQTDPKAEELAWAVESVSAPGGHRLLTAAGEKPTMSPVSLTMDADVKEAIRAAAAELGVIPDAVVADGYRKVLDGSYVPPRSTRERRRSKDRAPRTVLSVEVDDELRRQVRAVLPQLTAKLGYRVTESSIAIPWLTDELGVDLPDTVGSLQVVLEKPLRDHFQQQAERQGLSLQKLLEDGIRTLRSEGWTLPRPSRNPKGSATGTVAKLTVPVKTSLLDALEELAPKFSEEFEFRLFPGSIAIRILKDRLGEPPAAD